MSSRALACLLVAAALSAVLVQVPLLSVPAYESGLVTPGQG